MKKIIRSFRFYRSKATLAKDILVFKNNLGLVNNKLRFYFVLPLMKDTRPLKETIISVDSRTRAISETIGFD